MLMAAIRFARASKHYTKTFEKFKYLGTTFTNSKHIHYEICDRLNS